MSVAGCGVQVASDVIAVFKQAAGANADQILKRIADYGVQGRKDALDADMFTSPGVLSYSSQHHFRDKCWILASEELSLMGVRVNLLKTCKPITAARKEIHRRNLKYSKLVRISEHHHHAHIFQHSLPHYWCSCCTCTLVRLYAPL